MKHILVCALTFLGCACSNAHENPPRTVEKVNLERYLGRWYEIAAYPQWFERGMSHMTAKYSLSPRGYIKVENSGIRDGQLKIANGKARVVDTVNNSKLKVSFFGPFYAQYWIVGLADDYSWAVVSNEKRSTLWILSRTSQMDNTIYKNILSRLSNDGFDLSKLVKTLQ